MPPGHHPSPEAEVPKPRRLIQVAAGGLAEALGVGALPTLDVLSSAPPVHVHNHKERAPSHRLRAFRRDGRLSLSGRYGRPQGSGVPVGVHDRSRIPAQEGADGVKPSPLVGEVLLGNEGHGCTYQIDRSNHQDTVVPINKHVEELVGVGVAAGEGV